MSSCVPSMVHGATSSYVATVYMIRHWRKYGMIDNDLENQDIEVALMQFSCVRSLQTVVMTFEHKDLMTHTSTPKSLRGLLVSSSTVPSAASYLRGITHTAVAQLHAMKHSRMGSHLLDLRHVLDRTILLLLECFPVERILNCAGILHRGSLLVHYVLCSPGDAVCVPSHPRASVRILMPSFCPPCAVFTTTDCRSQIFFALAP
jgi:hypothetical protein